MENGGGGGGDGPVLMIVRTGPSRREFTRGSNHRGMEMGLSMNAAMEADWRQQQFQRQRMQLLSMAIFLCFMVLLFDNRAEQQTRSNRLRSNGGANNGATAIGGFRDAYGAHVNAFDSQVDEILQQRAIQHALNHEPRYDAHRNPLNVSGIYSGGWKAITYDDYLAKRPNYSDLIPFLRVDREIHPQRYTQRVHTGHTWLFLKMKPAATKGFDQEIKYVTGQVVIYDEETSLTATILPVQGVFLRRTGRLTLFGNSPDSTVQLLYRNLDNSTLSDGSHNGTMKNSALNASVMDSAVDQKTKIGGMPSQRERDEFSALDVSPPRYSYSHRFRSTDSFSDQCVSMLEFQLLDGDLSVPADDDAKARKHGYHDGSLSLFPAGQLRGTLASDNCALYLEVHATFEEANLDVFFRKAAHYAILMTLISMGEIYFLLRQLQISNTQATAAKVSLLTIGGQAILDSYLCLAHLTIGIVAQAIFTVFAGVAFIKLIIFSVFEMRYLLIIWKARRPQGFSEGWLVLRRELTTLYSRFYLSLLLGLFAIYNFWSYLPLLVFVAYSFWVPQIVHNVHREVRNPFDWWYLYGISVLRLFLPLYFYGCPHNFLTAFPTYESKQSPRTCYALIFWMGLQVTVLTLQQRLGPRFFIPARFLPVKYNYERRINPQQLSLLRSANEDTIDCVICMVELDVDARDYMIAPCDHIFHRECLQGWMQVKMECPTCRCVLPEP